MRSDQIIFTQSYPFGASKGLLPQEADDTSRHVEADGPLGAPPSTLRAGWRGASQEARGEGRPRVSVSSRCLGAAVTLLQVSIPYHSENLSFIIGRFLLQSTIYRPLDTPVCTQASCNRRGTNGARQHRGARTYHFDALPRHHRPRRLHDRRQGRRGKPGCQAGVGVSVDI